jgi:hypothetical protein
MEFQWVILDHRVTATTTGFRKAVVVTTANKRLPFTRSIKFPPRLPWPGQIILDFSVDRFSNGMKTTRHLVFAV